MNPNFKKEIENFLKKYKTIKYKKGQILIRPEDTFGKVILEKNGFARVYKISKTGEEISWPILKPMWIYSMITALNDNKSEYFIETVTQMEAWVIPIEDFWDFWKSKNIEDLYQLNIRNLVELTEKQSELLIADAYTKVAILLREMATNFGEKQGKKISLNFNIPHRVWASITGLTRETVTLQILKMQKQGILRNNKRKLVIDDIDRLK